MSGDQWPIFVYQGYWYDPEDPWNGLFRSSILVKVCLLLIEMVLDTQIATGLQTYIYFTKFGGERAKSYTIRQRAHSWYDEGYSHFNCVCGYTGMLLISIFAHCFQVMTLHLIKVRFALSSSPVFSRTDSVTDSERFYNTVLELFELPEEREEIDSLLTWWNRYVSCFYCYHKLSNPAF